ncbi:MAG: hypothetical protein K2N58_12090 [Treponemataceae bacterium]|nr:hypothetical protein [Treponemataceae bacterium]
MNNETKLKELDERIAQVRSELENVHGTQTEVYARIVGYYRAVRNWNKGKADEFKKRKMFELNCDERPDAVSQRPKLSAESLSESPQKELDLRDSALYAISTNSAENAQPETEIEQSEIFYDTASPQRISSYELFARRTCPNCPPVKDFLLGLSLQGNVVDVDTEEGFSEAAVKGVFSAPTVIFYDERGKEVSRAHNVPDIEEILSAVTA